MTHIPAPSGLDHNPDTDVSCTWQLTDTQQAVANLLGYDPGHGPLPRLTVAQKATIDKLVEWKERG